MSSSLNLARYLAHFALEQCAPEALPPAAVVIAKEMMVNAAAVGLAGAAQAEGQAITRFAQEMGGNGKCTIIGQGLRTSPALAALANGLMMHLLDFDDEIIPGGIHPSSIIFPVVMALGELNGGPGREVLAAFVLGCEVMAKLGVARSSNGSLSESAGAVGAAAAAGRLLGLDAAELAPAIALAAGGELLAVGAEASARGEPSEPLRPGVDVAGLAGPGRAWRQGRAAMNGVMAALLARQGLTGAVGQTSAGSQGKDSGYGWGYGNVAPEADIFARLGQPYAVLSPGVSLKLYPCASPAHTAIDVVLQLAQQYRIAPENIAAAQVGVTPAALAALPFPTPNSGWEARFCLGYIVAATLTYGPPLIDNFTDGAAQDHRVRQLMGRIAVEATETPSRAIPYPCSLAVTLRDGRRLRHRVEFARGQPELPLSAEELTAKFLYCSRYILPPDHIDEAVTQLRDLENVENTTSLFSALGG